MDSASQVQTTHQINHSKTRGSQGQGQRRGRVKEGQRERQGPVEEGAQVWESRKNQLYYMYFV